MKKQKACWIRVLPEGNLIQFKSTCDLIIECFKAQTKQRRMKNAWMLGTPNQVKKTKQSCKNERTKKIV